MWQARHALAHVAHVGGHDEGLVAYGGRGDTKGQLLAGPKRGVAHVGVGVAQREVAGGLPERAHVGGGPREAHLAGALGKDRACQGGEALAELVCPLVERVERAAQEAVEVHAAQLLARLGRREEVRAHARERRGVARVNERHLEADPALLEDVADALLVREERLGPDLLR